MCVADIDKSLGRRRKLEVVALICEVASGERDREKEGKKKRGDKHADNLFLVI